MCDTWIFGYGSLIWRADFPYAERRPAWIDGWDRRFWQGSTDHRGVPGAPGRVVTLVAARDRHCWGMAYRLPDDNIESILAHLDYREKGGYERLRLPVHFADGRSVEGTTWHATPDNHNYLGDADDADIAEQILRSSGPSGHNVEYVLELARSLTEMNAVDEHVFAIAALVRERT